MTWRRAGRVLMMLQPRTALLTTRGPAASYGTTSLRLSMTSRDEQQFLLATQYLSTETTAFDYNPLKFTQNDGFPGSGQTDFGPQLKSMNKQLFTIVAWDPRGYGQSIPPSRDFPPDFFERDAKDAVDLMQVNLLMHALLIEFHIDLDGRGDLKINFVHLLGSICQQLLPHIKCPTLIIHGEKDPLVPRFHAEYIHEHIKGSRLHFMPEGKHNLHLRFAEEFNKEVEDFLR
ncbi:UNVERIFIED_CONTAM: hypothetical protein H355_008062 [Colinus virginianus]|nr:hypothetical protein H355_008062 [Colinus virginianus]